MGRPSAADMPQPSPGSDAEMPEAADCPELQAAGRASRQPACRPCQGALPSHAGPVAPTPSSSPGKRPAGRPRSTVPASPAQPQPQPQPNPAAALPSPPKRPVGRPRKNPVPAAQPSVDAAAGASPLQPSNLPRLQLGRPRTGPRLHPLRQPGHQWAGPASMLQSLTAPRPCPLCSPRVPGGPEAGRARGRWRVTASRRARGCEQLPPGLSPAGAECSSPVGSIPCTLSGACGQGHCTWSLCLPWHTLNLHSAYHGTYPNLHWQRPESHVHHSGPHAGCKTTRIPAGWCPAVPRPSGAPLA